MKAPRSPKDCEVLCSLELPGIIVKFRRSSFQFEFQSK